MGQEGIMVMLKMRGLLSSTARPLDCARLLRQLSTMICYGTPKPQMKILGLQKFGSDVLTNSKAGVFAEVRGELGGETFL